MYSAFELRIFCVQVCALEKCTVQEKIKTGIYRRLISEEAVLKKHFS